MLDSIKQLIENSLPKPTDYTSTLKAELDEALSPIVALSCGTEWATLYDGLGLPAEAKSVVLGPACVLMIVVQPRLNGKGAAARLTLEGFGRLTCGATAVATGDRDIKGTVLNFLAEAEKAFETDQNVRREHRDSLRTRVRDGRKQYLSNAAGVWQDAGSAY